MTRTTALFATALFALSASLSASAATVGSLAPAGAADRIVSIAPGARYLNVTDGETVTVKVGDAAFTWHVDTAPGHAVFPLSEIAPADIAAGGVTVYVDPNPRYFGN
jgi:Heavy-metal resistance protein CzcE